MPHPTLDLPTMLDLPIFGDIYLYLLSPPEVPPFRLNRFDADITGSNPIDGIFCSEKRDEMGFRKSFQKQIKYIKNLPESTGIWYHFAQFWSGSGQISYIMRNSNIYWIKNVF